MNKFKKFWNLVLIRSNKPFNNMKFIKAAIFLFSLSICVLVPLSVSAATATPEFSIIDPNDTAYEHGNYTLDSATAMMVKIAGIILQIVGVLTFAMFIYGGFLFLISAGNPKTVETAKKIIIAAVIGLIIVFVSYALVQFFISSITGQALNKITI